ncbi:MAG TPA: lipopolysaccharide transport periplasmic protein LptA [Pseudomonas xinjiangensis]|uniref:Lipopolysaccharide export system protein LptA n=2 Tax=root TaxID=1 RepID=A0A7V1FRV3_9GAMM|nr:lipopolysaccharide transport periplasmic protein LptA [Halopseudomonas xinjiangensis]HEC48262.1 lipopolysaccharide transport periplasmic protein LptA [Halopseudomonas xinjiangensis]
MLSPTLPAFALPEDSEQPIRIQADTATLDDRRNTAVYTGDVVITQGTMRLTGDQVTLNTDAEGAVSKIVSVGNPATFVQTPQPDQGPVNARGQTIEYYAADERVVLIDDAHLDQEGNTFEGEYVTYNVREELVEAGRAGESTEAPQRIQMTIQPRKRDEPAAQ